MSDYTPTTNEVREMWAEGSGVRAEVAFAEFNRWLASVKAEAWDEGFLLATRNNPTKPHPMLRMNPYREEQ